MYIYWGNKLSGSFLQSQQSSNTININIISTHLYFSWKTSWFFLRSSSNINRNVKRTNQFKISFLASRVPITDNLNTKGFARTTVSHKTSKMN